MVQIDAERYRLSVSSPRLRRCQHVRESTQMVCASSKSSVSPQRPVSKAGRAKALRLLCESFLDINFSIVGCGFPPLGSLRIGTGTSVQPATPRGPDQVNALFLQGLDFPHVRVYAEGSRMPFNDLVHV
jgi:hypothetical protein